MRWRTAHKRRQRLRNKFAVILWVRLKSGQVKRTKSLIGKTYRLVKGPLIPVGQFVEFGSYLVRRAR